jgi:glycerol-3-phosphate acyltransferase PlsY
MSDTSSLAYVLALVVGYLLGSLPFALWISRARGVDIMSVGSGNPGMTNVWRTLGWKPALPVALLDSAKGAAAAWFGLLLTGSVNWALAAGIAAVLGHSFSFWIGFKGGKSVLTAFGVFLFLSPLASLGALLLWAFVMAVFGYVSLASILAAAGLPLFIVFESSSSASDPFSMVFFVSLAVCAFIVVRHRANIARLLRGTEPKFRGKAQ